MIRALLVLTVLLTCAARADTEWLLTTSDLATQRITLTGIDSAGVRGTISGGGAIAVPLDRFLSIGRAQREARPVSRWLLVLTDGQRIAGEPVSTANETLKWRSSMGEIDIPMRTIAAINGVPSAAPASEDEVRLSNGDQVRGVITELSAESVSVQSAAGEVTPIPLQAVASAVFANVRSPHLNDKAIRVGLVDGSTVSASAIVLDSAQLRFQSFDGKPRGVPLESILLIEQINGPVTWLSSLTPVEAVRAGYFGDAPPAADASSVQGSPNRSIRAHSYSRLVYDIPRGARVLRTQFAIDGDLPYADVTIRVLLDGRPQFERRNVRAGKPGDPLVLDVGSARQVALEVDFGENYDVQDRVVWIEPAFLREAPATRPSQ